MIRQIRWLLVIAAAGLLTVSCSSQGGGTQPPEGGPPPGTPPGLLVAAGAGILQTFDLSTNKEWSQRLGYSAPWSTETVVAADRELLIANTSGAEPVIIKVLDLDTFGLKESFEWPDSAMSATTLLSLAATRDGNYLAIVMNPLAPRFLEVIERATGRIVYTGLQIATGATMVWTTDDRLVVPVDLRHENDPGRWGAIVSFALADLEASTDGSVDGELILSFSRAEWDPSGVSGLSLTPDDSELVFERAGDLWVVDMQPGSTPHQLTTGPASNHGAVFSPDGTRIAFASGSSLGLQETYIIPNHRAAPLFIDYSQGAGNEYLVAADTLVESLLAWLP